MKNFITCRRCKTMRGLDVKICPACRMTEQKQTKITESEGHRRQIIGNMRGSFNNRMKKVITTNQQ